MNSVYCMYYDEEIDQDVPLQPSLKEALTFFKSFKWENVNEDSAMKVISFQVAGDNEGSLTISRLESDSWEVGAQTKCRRPYFGPFFKRESFNLFFDINEQEVEQIISYLYQLQISEFSLLLTENKEISVSEA